MNDRSLSFTSLLENTTETVALAFQRTRRILAEHSKIGCSVSGGSDSDIMLDMLYRLDTEKKVKYYYVDTGLEMQATKDHIVYLQEKYGIEIETVKPKTPIPLAVKKFGQPFISKDFADKIHRLQMHHFCFEDMMFDEINRQYPNVIGGAQFWCDKKGGAGDISSKPFLKPFIIQNKPTFHISDKCCYYGKKQPGKAIEKKNGFDLVCLGIRTAEGGIRSIQYKSCFLPACNGGVDKHFPIFWFKDADKRAYEKYFGVTHSRAYTEYGFKRTGCCGCPFNSKHKQELEILDKYEPKLAQAARKIFADSYEYYERYQQFKHEKKYENQMTLF